MIRIDRSGGLSPLARETQCHHPTRKDSARFIPAGAGNTDISNKGHLRFPVYPRWRGEHVYSSPHTITADGLSPLARGTLVDRSGADKPARFIPAGAGNTLSSSAMRRSAAVYPRWRGEHARGSINQQITVGLSPLARGTPGSSCLTIS